MDYQNAVAKTAEVKLMNWGSLLIRDRHQIDYVPSRNPSDVLWMTSIYLVVNAIPR